MDQPSSTKRTPIDVALAVLTGAMLIFVAVVFPVVVAPSFRNQFAQSNVELPALTMLMLNAWVPPILAVPGLLAMLAALVVGKRAIGVAAFVLAAFACAIALLSMFLPA